MDFTELVALLREPGEREVPGTIYDDLNNAYNTAVEGGSARVVQVETANAELLAEVARLKALNFDLLMAATAEPVSTNEETEQVNNDVATLDTIFERQ